jgi:hypothetical protein
MRDIYWSELERLYIRTYRWTIDVLLLVACVLTKDWQWELASTVFQWILGILVLKGFMLSNWFRIEYYVDPEYGTVHISNFRMIGNPVFTFLL